MFKQVNAGFAQIMYNSLARSSKEKIVDIRRRIGDTKFIKEIDYIHTGKLNEIKEKVQKYQNRFSVIGSGIELLAGDFLCALTVEEIAKECIEMNFYISFGGPVTFKNAKKVKEVALQIPLDRLLIETDCPYLTPHPYRGKRNEPSYVKLVAEELASIKNLSFEELAHITTSNAKKLFQLDN